MPLKLTDNGSSVNYICSINPTSVTRAELRFSDYLTTGSFLTINTTGNIGIGTNTPTVPLEINGSNAATFSATNRIYKADGTLINYPTGIAISMKLSHGVLAPEYIAASDERIKKNIIDINPSLALDYLRLLKPKSYNYIDDIKYNSNHHVYGFSAQDVKQVLKNAVYETSEFVPNIFCLASTKYTTMGTIISISSDKIQTDNLDNNSVLRLYLDLKNTIKDIGVEKIIGPNKILLKEILDQNLSDVFVYGEKVNNFHILNKDSIWTVTTSALQAIDKQLQQTKSELATVKTFLQNKFPGEI